MIARMLPAKVRSFVYSVLATLFAIEAIWNVVPPGYEDKVLATVGALGFSLAYSKTTDVPPPAPVWPAPVNEVPV